MKCLKSLLWRGVFSIALLVAVSTNANSQTGCTDSNACNFDPGAVTDDGSCAYTGIFIPVNVGDGPAIEACAAPVGYYFADQACVASVVASDPFCIDPAGSWDNLCEEAYNSCLGCVDPAFYIPYNIGTGPAVEVCDGSEPAGYYAPDQACLESVLGSDDYCMTVEWDDLCQNDLDQCTLGCFADWHIPIVAADGPAVRDCGPPAGYWTPDQDCVEFTIAADPFCTETEWDILCQNAYTNCSVGCSDAQWYIPTSAGVGPAVLECAPPPGYELPASPICFFEVVAADPFCIQIEWDQVCIDAYDDCTSGCTYEFACNYSPGALFDDGSCGQQGCTDLNAVNFNPSAVCDDGSCVLQNECPADFDNNNTVNAADLLQFLTFFGNTCE